jgi:hypothetical protein
MVRINARVSGSVLIDVKAEVSNSVLIDVKAEVSDSAMPASILSYILINAYQSFTIMLIAQGVFS